MAVLMSSFACSENRAKAEQHILLDGTSLTNEQRFEAGMQHVEESIRSEVSAMGEVLLQLSGSRSVVSGDLSSAQRATVLDRIKAVSDEVRRRSCSNPLSRCTSLARYVADS